MTDAERRAAIAEAIRAYTKANTSSREAARAALIREGIYTPEGQLTPEYGGPP